MRVLSPGVSAVRIADEVIFLDLRGDAYVALSDAGRAITLRDASTALDVDDVPLAEELEAAGLVQDGLRPFSLRNAKVGERDLGAGERPLRLADMAAFAIAVCWTALRHRRAKLSDLVAWSAQRRTGRGEPSEAERLSQTWNRLMVWCPLQGDCLFRSHLLLRYLRLRGCDADWVFGVRTWPFAAHCWVQRGSMVLNDRAEALSAFAPILVV